VKLRRIITNLFALVDLGTCMVYDVDRELVRAAKRWVRLCREQCEGSCECCDAQIATAWWWCGEWRRLQQVKRNVCFPLASMVLAIGGGR